MPRYSDKQKAAIEVLMKEEIYHHVMNIVVDEGLGAFSMERLAKLIGVSRGTLYNYFADRDAVIDFVEERTFASILDAIVLVAESDLPADERFTSIAETVFTAVYQDRALVVALTPKRLSSAGDERNEARMARVLAVVEPVIRDGIESGVFRDLHPGLVVRFFFGAVESLICSMGAKNSFLPPQEVVPTLMEVFLGGMRKTR